MSEILGDVKELNEINKEIRRCASELKKMRERKVQVENKILETLQEKQFPGFKYKNINVMMEDGKSRVRKNKDERIRDGSSILKQHGIDNSEEILNKVMDAMKGKEIPKHKLKIRIDKKR